MILENVGMSLFTCYFWTCFFLSGILFLADVETNECLENNGGCWQDKGANITACKVFISNGKLLCYVLSLSWISRTYLSFYLFTSCISVSTGYIPWKSV